MDEAQIYERLTEIFRDIFDDDFDLGDTRIVRQGCGRLG